MRGDGRGADEGCVRLEHDALNGLRIDHSGELVCESFGGAMQYVFRGEEAVLAASGAHAASSDGVSSAMRVSTLVRISSRIRRTVSGPCPAGSSICQSS